MADTAPNSIKQLLQTQDSALQRIFSKVQQLKQLNDVFMQALDPTLKKYCIVANVHVDKLVILTQNAAIATQLRFAVPDLLPKLQSHPLLKDIKTIECRVGS
jgi:hypothetical protein